MAIEDAYAVPACLSKYAKEPMAVLGRYQDIRRDCTAAVVRKAHENGKQAFSLELTDEDATAIFVARGWLKHRPGHARIGSDKEGYRTQLVGAVLAQTQRPYTTTDLNRRIEGQSAPPTACKLLFFCHRITSLIR
jgi:type II secretory pathway component PulJ